MTMIIKERNLPESSSNIVSYKLYLYELRSSSSKHSTVSLVTNSSDVFTNFIHEFFSIWATEKEKNNFSFVQNRLVYLNLSLEKEIIINIC